MTSAERYSNEEQNKIKHHRIPHNSKDLRHQRDPRALNSPDRTGLKSVQICEICGRLEQESKTPLKIW